MRYMLSAITAIFVIGTLASAVPSANAAMMMHHKHHCKHHCKMMHHMMMKH